MSTRKILFFILRNLHVPHLTPVFRYLEKNADQNIELAFGTAPDITSEDGIPGYGIDETSQLSLNTNGHRPIAFDDIPAYRPDVVVMADSDFRCGIDKIGARIANINHGLISKGAFIPTAPSQNAKMQQTCSACQVLFTVTPSDGLSSNL